MADQKENDHAYETLKELLVKWWGGLKRRSGERSELRRCKNIEEILCSSAYARCYNFLQKEGLLFYPNHEKLGTVVGMLAHVDDLAKPNLPTAMGQVVRENTPHVSESRFQKLLKIKSRYELYQPMIRIIRHLNKKIDVWNLIDSIYQWEEKETLKKEWAMAYYKIAPPRKQK